MFNRPFTIALDGPAAAGKGTIARALATLKRLLMLGIGFQTMPSTKATIRAINEHRIIKNNHARCIKPGIKCEVDLARNLLQNTAYGYARNEILA